MGKEREHGGWVHGTCETWVGGKARVTRKDAGKKVLQVSGARGWHLGVLTDMGWEEEIGGAGIWGGGSWWPVAMEGKVAICMRDLVARSRAQGGKKWVKIGKGKGEVRTI